MRMLSAGIRWEGRVDVDEALGFHYLFLAYNFCHILYCYCRKQEGPKHGNHKAATFMVLWPL